jgi:hypothetical protein
MAGAPMSVRLASNNTEAPWHVHFFVFKNYAVMRLPEDPKKIKRTYGL